LIFILVGDSYFRFGSGPRKHKPALRTSNVPLNSARSHVEQQIGT